MHTVTTFFADAAVPRPTLLAPPLLPTNLYCKMGEGAKGGGGGTGGPALGARAGVYDKWPPVNASTVAYIRTRVAGST